MSITENTLETVMLSDLRFGHDPDCGMNVNARRSDRDADIEDFAGIIRAQGLLQSLIGCRGPGGSARPIFVAGGNRRLAALRIIHGDDSNVGVPVMIVPRERALEASQVEGVTQLPLTMIDQFQTFYELTQPPHNMTPEDIAMRFMIRDPRIVRQRLALGALSPMLLDVWRAKGIGDQEAMAFTMTPDAQEQERIFSKLKRAKKLYAHEIRREIAGSDEDAGRYVEFVGRDIYEKAGGKIIEDLFGGRHGVSDFALLKKEVELKLAQKKEFLAAEGWSWVENYDDLGTAQHSWSHISYDPKYKFKVADRERSGCILRIGADGKLNVQYGVIQPSAEKKKEKASAKKKSNAGVADATMSAALTERASAWMTAAVASVIEGQPKAALTLAIAALATHICPVKIRATGPGSDKLIADGNFAALVARVAKFPEKQRMALLAKLVGASLDLARSSGPIFDSETVGILSALDRSRTEAAILAAFKRNAEDYFGGVSRERIVASLSEIAPKLSYSSTQTKAALAKVAADAASHAKSIWLPVELRTPYYRGPGAKRRK